jgi:hypothetical protein
MRYSLYFLFGLLFLSSCGDMPDEGETQMDNKQKIRIKVYHYGIWGRANADNMYDAPSNLIKETDTIKLEVDRSIGIQYEISSSPGNEKSITLRQVWVLPHKRYDDDYGYSVDRLEETVYPSYSQYGFMQHKITREELEQKGRWQLLVYYGNRLMYRKNFFLT